MDPGFPPNMLEDLENNYIVVLVDGSDNDDADADPSMVTCNPTNDNKMDDGVQESNPSIVQKPTGSLPKSLPEEIRIVMSFKHNQLQGVHKNYLNSIKHKFKKNNQRRTIPKLSAPAASTQPPPPSSEEQQSSQSTPNNNEPSYQVYDVSSSSGDDQGQQELEIDDEGKMKVVTNGSQAQSSLHLRPGVQHNTREKHRRRLMSDGFVFLKNLVPSISGQVRSVAKVAVLKEAKDYINELKRKELELSITRENLLLRAQDFKMRLNVHRGQNNDCDDDLYQN